MDIMQMLSKMNSKDMEMGLKSISGMLSPQQKKEIESVLGNQEKLGQMLSGVNVDKLQSEFKSNPNLSKQLQNPEFLKQLNDIFKK